MDNKENRLSEGNVLLVLLKFTVPVLLAILLQITYGTVDLWVISQFATVADLSAVTIGSQIMNGLTFLCGGLAMGTTVLLGQYLGAKKYDKMTKTIGVSISIFILLAIILSSVFVFFNAEIATAMKTPLEAVSQTQSYLFICGVGNIFVVFYNLIASIFRGVGDSKTPLMVVFVACIINIFLDLLFVCVFGMGAAGAASATVIAQGASVLFSLVIIRKSPLPCTFTIKDISLELEYFFTLLKIGLPIAVQSILITASFLVVTSVVNNFGVVASGALGIVEKIAVFIMIIPMAFMQSLSAFTAQNYGASKLDRAEKGLLYAIIISFAFGGVSSYVAWFQGHLFTGIFTDNPDTTAAATLYLKAYSIETLLTPIMFCITGYLSGLGKTTFVMFQGIFGAFLVRIPVVYLFSTIDGVSLFVIGLATPISTFLQNILCIAYYLRLRKILNK